MNNYEELINKKCKIIPFEQLEGIITGIYITKKGKKDKISVKNNTDKITLISNDIELFDPNNSFNASILYNFS